MADQMESHTGLIVRSLRAAAAGLANWAHEELRWHGREPKSSLDPVLEETIFSELSSSGLPILSEESSADLPFDRGRVWIVDPLDGTLNFARGCGPSAISIALFEDGRPVVGGILDVASQRIVWGGRGLGAQLDSAKVEVSAVAAPSEAVVLTGFPSSFDFGDERATDAWMSFVSRFGKVRMIGSAASSLVLVARGAADFYFEDDIKIWDVAAGLAIVEGAGGSFRIEPGRAINCVRVRASNRGLATLLAI